MSHKVRNERYEEVELQSRGSAVDTELSFLMNKYPTETNRFIRHNVMGRTLDKSRKDDFCDAQINHRVPLSKTHYQETYIPKDSRPRSTKKPPNSPRDKNPPSMTFDTWQKDTFKPFGVIERQEPFKMNATYEPTTAPLDGISMYKKDYPVKELLVVEKKKGQVSKRHPYKIGAEFYDETTSKNHFKPWQIPRNLHFGEIPSFTGSILYPNNRFNGKTTTGDSYQGHSVQAKTKPVKRDRQNITLEGEHDFLTVQRDTYRPYDVTGRPAAFNTDKQLSMDDRSKVPFNGETQFMRDFPGFKSKQQPMPPDAAPPYESTITLQFDDSSNYNTEQRMEFTGIDVSKYPTSIVKKSKDEFIQPAKKFETETVTKKDFRPIDLSTMDFSAKPRKKDHSIMFKGKFSDETTSKNAFIDRSNLMEPVRKYGDFNEAIQYAPMVQSLEGVTETQAAFVRRSLSERTRNYKPERKAADLEGTHDFNTSYRTDYVKPKYRLTKEQARILKAELLQLKPADGTCNVKFTRKNPANNDKSQCVISSVA